MLDILSRICTRKQQHSKFCIFHFTNCLQLQNEFLTNFNIDANLSTAPEKHGNLINFLKV